MYDQSFNFISLSKELRRSDFLNYSFLRDPIQKKLFIEHVVTLSEDPFSHQNIFNVSQLGRNNIYSLSNFKCDVITRKINRNLSKVVKIKKTNRNNIISNIKNIISEGVPYRVYRLDIKSFYESFQHEEIVNHFNTYNELAPKTKKLLKDFINAFERENGRGLPRGLTISATISEIMMRQFDLQVSQCSDVFYYSRYVDDIILITNSKENSYGFLSQLEENLPVGLSFNRKKTNIIEYLEKVNPYKTNSTSPNLNNRKFEYLGYSFSVSEPPKVNKIKEVFRDVVVDIADTKVKKIKTRIIKSLIDYTKNHNFNLLESRLRLLTSNFSVPDRNREKTRLAGIYYNYHAIDSSKSIALNTLDVFLKKSVLSSHGNIFHLCSFTKKQRASLLRFHFKNGFDKKIFMHVSASELNKIQECWCYEK
ncbi:MAG: antiviral reverse transcriptase Drt3a [Aeromonas veronii]|uniref:antiviral reverse transcriptase Drt3a n=1 Tax=Aeromonas veronii TaxID=654 RepID=UPI000A6A005E